MLTQKKWTWDLCRTCWPFSFVAYFFANPHLKQCMWIAVLWHSGILFDGHVWTKIGFNAFFKNAFTRYKLCSLITLICITSNFFSNSLTLLPGNQSSGEDTTQFLSTSASEDECSPLPAQADASGTIAVIFCRSSSRTVNLLQVRLTVYRTMHNLYKSYSLSVFCSFTVRHKIGGGRN